MTEQEMNTYASLNSVADTNGTVILGGSADRELPIGELKQAFGLEEPFYNRSVAGLSVKDAAEVYNACVAPLAPETVLLHIGDADLTLFGSDPSAFDGMYRALIGQIRSLDRKCRIGIVSLKNPTADGTIAELNKHLKYIADAERCEYGDISVKRVWNPQQTKDVVSFVNSTGFVRPLNIKPPIYDLVRILFCFE